jgi:MFS transporter, SHS family, lactate transporter
LFVRFGVKESEVWERTRNKTWTQLGRDIFANWKLFVYLMLLMTTMSLSSHGTQDMFPTFLERQWHFGASQRAVISGFSMVGAIIGGVLMGLYSDRVGRRRAIITALLFAILLIPLWAYSPSVALVYVGAFLMQFMVQGAFGVIPAHLAELSPDSVRGFLPGFAYQCGVLLSSSVVYIQSIYAQRTSYAAAMAFTAVTVFSAACVATAVGRERRGAEFG